jgi:hypothetical protein
MPSRQPSSRFGNPLFPDPAHCAAIHRKAAMLLPGARIRIIPSHRKTGGPHMAKLIPFLAQFGLFAQKPDAADLFDLRLTRIGTREARARSLGLTFKSRPSHSAGAATS